MSRAFVKEDGGHVPPGRFGLPPRDDPGYDAAAAKKSEGNALFKEIEASQKEFAKRVVRWDLDTNVQRRMAYNHYFGQKAAAPKKA